MKTAIASSTARSAFVSGETTQFEWIEWCATELLADGVVLDVDDFPRTDDDYVAQIKKFCADAALTLVAVADNDAFADEARDDATIALALALGAPLAVLGVRPRPLSDEGAGWTGVLERAGAAARLAKARNITLAVRNDRERFLSDANAMKRIAKDTDSAWLRYALDVAALDEDAFAALAPKLVIAIARTAGDDDVLARRLARFPGFVVVDGLLDGDWREGTRAIRQRLRT